MTDEPETRLAFDANSWAGSRRARYGARTPDALQPGAVIEAGCTTLLSNDRRLSGPESLRIVQLGAAVQHSAAGEAVEAGVEFGAEAGVVGFVDVTGVVAHLKQEQIVFQPR